MSLYIELSNTLYFECECGKKSEIDREYVFGQNITHNLTDIAKAAGIYKCLWCADKYEKASDLIPELTDGLMRWNGNPDYFTRMNPENGWGTAKGLFRFAEKLRYACCENPNAKIEVSK